MGNSLGLKSEAFNRVRSDDDEGMVLDVMGPERSGKSDFACSIAEAYPDKPTAYLALDFNYKGPVRRHRKLGSKIVPAEFFYSLPQPPPTSPKDNDFKNRVNAIAGICRPVFKSFQNTLWEVLQSKAVGAVVIDNGSSLYKLCRFAMFGYIHRVPMHLYPKSTNAMLTILNQVRYSGKPVCWIHRQSEEWVNNEPSGQFYRAGFKEVGYEVMASLQAERIEEGKHEGKFAVEVLDSTFNNETVGHRFIGKNRTFRRVEEILRATE